nr:DIE2/ALG10 family [Tanacetum cinerariifolium]
MVTISKEEEIQKISTSIFVTNFSDHAKAKDLWNVCKQYGQVVDAFIPDRKSKAGKRYGFVRFIRVYDVDRLVSNLCTLWMGRDHLHANVARKKQREEGDNQQPKPKQIGEDVCGVLKPTSDQEMEHVEGDRNQESNKSDPSTSNQKSYTAKEFNLASTSNPISSIGDFELEEDDLNFSDGYEAQVYDLPRQMQAFCDRFHIRLNSRFRKYMFFLSGSESRPPMLNKKNYVPWSSRLLCASNTLDPLNQKLMSKIVELQFQVVNYERKVSHLKTTYKNLFDSIKSNQAHAKFYNLIYENAQLTARVFANTFESVSNTSGMSVTPHVNKPKLSVVTPHSKKLHASISSHSVPQPKEFNVVKHRNVIALECLRSIYLKHLG